MVEKSGVEKSGVGKFMVEKSGMEGLGLKLGVKKSRVEMSFNPQRDRETPDINGNKIQLMYEGSEYLGNMNQPYL